MTDPPDIPAARALCAAATPGPWQWEGVPKEFKNGNCGIYTPESAGECLIAMIQPQPDGAYGRDVDRELSAANADFVSASRTIIPALCDELEAAKADVAFLLSRAAEAGRCTFSDDRWVGLSSNSIVAIAYGGDPATQEMPSDPGDLLACLRTYYRLPRHRRPEVVIAAIDAARKALAGKYDTEEVDAIATSEAAEAAKGHADD